MYFFVWQGYGWLVPIITFGCCILTELTVEFAMQNDEFYQDNAWCPFLALMFAASAITVLAMRAYRESDRIVEDVETGEIFVLETRRHLFFFVPMRYWPILILCFAFFILFCGFQ